MKLQAFLALNLGPRKERLAVCAFARSVWPLLIDARSKMAVECAERFADGLATEDDRWRAFDVAVGDDYQNVQAIAWISCNQDFRLIGDVETWLDDVTQCPHEAILDDLTGPTRECEECKGGGKFYLADCQCCRGSGRVLLPQTLCGGDHPQEYSAWGMEGLEQRKYNCTTCNRVLSWNGGTVQRIAESTYANHCQSGYEQLHDALMEAGCENAVILGHCRKTHTCLSCNDTGFVEYEEPVYGGLTKQSCNHVGEKPVVHARGCWVTDLILGKV